MNDPVRAPAPAAAPVIAPSLFLFAVIYGGMVCIAGVIANKQVSLGPLSGIGTLLGAGPLAVEAGIFAFLVLVVLSSAVAELHGRAIANRLVAFGFVPLIMSMLLLFAVLAVPPSPTMEPERLAAFELMMGSTPRIWAAGIVAYGVSQTLNVTLFTAMKRDGGRLLWLRGVVAAALSQIVDTLLFISVAFAGVFPIADLLIGQMLAKVVLSALVVPPLIYLAVAAGRRLDER